MKDIGKNSIIARILAGEKIMLAIQENQSTASFDLKTRIIRIPNYMYEDDDFTTMVIGHEVSHCLNTPYEGWLDWIKGIKNDPNVTDEQKKYAKGCLNIIEDVRIDKLIQRKYPGIVKYYKKSTKFMVESDFFRIKKLNKNVNNMSFLNRLCVYSKCDYHNTMHSYNVKFSAEEQIYVDRVFQLEDFDETCDLALEILKKFDHKDDDIEFDNDEESEDQTDGDEDDSDDKKESNLYGRHNVDDEMLGDEGESEGEENSNVSMGGLGGDTKTLHDLWSNQLSVPKANLAISNSYSKKIGTKDIFEIKSFKTVPFYTGNRESNTEKVKALSKDYDKYVNLFSMKFNQRKRARELVNNFERDVGCIDPLKLHKYRYEEKIFQKKDIENYQKNHGFIFLIDCSSSMSDIFKSLTMQIFAFHRICERINVPYAIFGYTTGYNSKDQIKTNFNSSNLFYKFMETGDSRKEIYENVANLIDGNLAMGGTPTSDSLLGLVPEIKRFRSSFTPDIMNLIVITDGSDGTRMDSSSLSFNGGLYHNKISPRGVVDNNSAIYRLMRDFYDVKIFHMDITDQIPSEFMSSDESEKFIANGFLQKKDFGGADNVLWVKEKLISDKSTKIIDSFVNILA